MLDFAKSVILPRSTVNGELTPCAAPFQSLIALTRPRSSRAADCRETPRVVMDHVTWIDDVVVGVRSRG